MPWLFLLLAFGAFAVAFKTTSMALMAISLLAALGFGIAWLFGLMAARVGNATQDTTAMIDPIELKRMREEAEARRNQGNAASPAASSTMEKPAPIWPHQRQHDESAQ